MERQIELSKEQKDEDKLLIAKVLDKIKFAENRNRFETTDFLDLREQKIVKSTFSTRKIKSYTLTGGYDDAERKLLIAFPEYFNINLRVYNQIFGIIRITLPNNLIGEYEHRIYLGGLMKLGIKREKIGDILVRKEGADIVVKKDIEDYILHNISELTRFQKSRIEIKGIEELIYEVPKKEIIKINVPSMRLDCFVGELARCSRSEAIRILNGERVFVNFKEEIRPTKIIQEGDYITIRGKGRFKINRILGNTKSGRISVEVEK